MKEPHSNEIQFKNHLLINQDTGECYETNIEIKKIYNVSTKAKGYRIMYIQEDGILESCLTDGCHPKLALSICRNISKDGILKHIQKHYAKELGCDISSIKRYWAIMKKHELIAQDGKTTYVNPYVALPYNVKDEDANMLQQQWDLLMRSKKQ